MNGLAPILQNDGFRRAFYNDVTTFVASSGSHIDDPITARDHLHVVLDQDHSISPVNQSLDLTLQSLHV